MHYMLKERDYLRLILCSTQLFSCGFNILICRDKHKSNFKLKQIIPALQKTHIFSYLHGVFNYLAAVYGTKTVRGCRDASKEESRGAGSTVQPCNTQVVSP